MRSLGRLHFLDSRRQVWRLRDRLRDSEVIGLNFVKRRELSQLLDDPRQELQARSRHQRRYCLCRS